MPARFGGWDKVTECKVRRKWTVGSTEDEGSGEGRMWLVLCCSAVDETGRLGGREGGSGEVLLA